MRANLNKEKKNNQISDQEYKAHLNDLNMVVADLNAKVETLQKENVVLVNQKDSLGRDITQKVEVKPSVDFSKLEEVLVVTHADASPAHVELIETREADTQASPTPKPSASGGKTR